jgi:hypothetical protein
MKVIVRRDLRRKIGVKEKGWMHATRPSGALAGRRRITRNKNVYQSELINRREKETSLFLIRMSVSQFHAPALLNAGRR